MAVRYPLVIDTTDNNKIKELPANDSLNLNTNSIVNAVNITASGTLTVANLVVDSNSVSINGNPLGTVALTNSYTDLSNTPSLFDGTYAALTGRPSIPASTEDLSDVGSTQATNGQALIYDTSLGRYEPGNIADASIDLTNQDLGELQNVVLTGAVANQILKYNGTAFVNTTVHFSEITNKPTTLAGFGITDAQLAGAPHDGDITGSVFGDDSTLLVDGVNNKVTLTNNTTTELTEGTNLYYTDVRADARITNAGSANWNTAFGWGNHASAGYQVAGAPHDGDVTGSVFGDDSTVLVDGVNNTLHGVVLGGMQVIAGPGVINLTTTSTEIITTGTDAFTLANGVSGQIKHIIKMGGSSTATITPASFANGTSIELNATYDTVSLLYTTGGWVVTAGQSFTINA